VIANVSGIDHAFEAPTAPDARLDTVGNDVASNVASLLSRIEARGFAQR
jgi:adenylylsulfate kinase-like enzyme